MAILFENPEYMYYIIPALIVLGVLIWKDFVAKGSRKRKTFFFLSRAFIIAFVIPFVFETKLVEGNPRIKLLIDNSTSMDLFEYNVSSLADKMQERIPVVKKTIASDGSSPLGDNILSNVERNSNILLYTDGQITSGETIDSLFSLISNLNVTINSIKIEPKHTDISVAIIGPSETVPGANNNFLINLENTKGPEIQLKVVVDNEVIFNSRTFESIPLQQTFLSEGYHTIKAEVLDNDFFPQNNIFYKTVKVIEKPKILYLRPEIKKADPIKEILATLYDVDERADLPEEFSSYYAIIVNDMKAKDLEDTDNLKKYLID